MRLNVCFLHSLSRLSPVSIFSPQEIPQSCQHVHLRTLMAPKSSPAKGSWCCHNTGDITGFYCVQDTMECLGEGLLMSCGSKMDSLLTVFLITQKSVIPMHASSLGHKAHRSVASPSSKARVFWFIGSRLVYSSCGFECFVLRCRCRTANYIARERSSPLGCFWSIPLKDGAPQTEQATRQ